MGEMTPDKGVFKRKGSDAWQHRVYVPKDLRPLYGGKDALPAKSLQTRDLAEANRRARLRVAEFEREFQEKRAALVGGTAVHGAGPSRKLTPEAIERLAAGYHARVIEKDFAHRAATFARATTDPKAFWNGEIIPEPNDWNTSKGHPYSYWAYLTEDPETPLEVGLAYALKMQREARLASVKAALHLGKVEILVPTPTRFWCTTSMTTPTA
jgi:hypothetical protein